MNKVIALGAAILTQFYYLCKTYITKQKKKKLIALISTLQVLSPKELSNKLRNNIGAEAFQLCKGKLFPGEACYSVLNPDLKVAYSILFEGQFKKITSKSELLKITGPSFMELKDSSECLKLYQAHSSVIFPTRVMRFNIHSMFHKFIQSIKSIFSKKVPSQKLQLSQFFNYQNVYQLFLPQGAQMTVFGKFGIEGNDVVCSHPKMIFPNQKQMMQFIQQSISSLNVIHVILGFGITVCGVFMLKQIVRMVRSMKKNVQSSLTFASLRRIFQKSRLCTVCHRNLSCIYFYKCRHMAICDECMKKTRNLCQFCDSKDTEFVEMFVC